MKLSASPQTPSMLDVRPVTTWLKVTVQQESKKELSLAIITMYASGKLTPITGGIFCWRYFRQWSSRLVRKSGRPKVRKPDYFFCKSLPDFPTCGLPDLK